MAYGETLGNLEYDALIDIAASEIELVGELSLQFDLSDASSNLTLDFTGGTLNSVLVNGEEITDAYNGYFITLPSERLQLGSNMVELIYRHPFGHGVEIAEEGGRRHVDIEDSLDRGLRGCI